MAKSYPDVQGTVEWQDITALPSHAAVANQRVTIQAKGGQYNYVYFGGDTPPGPGEGIVMPSVESLTGTSDHIWVRGNTRFAVLAED